jgi:hypothetical protein
MSDPEAGAACVDDEGEVLGSDCELGGEEEAVGCGGEGC